MDVSGAPPAKKPSLAMSPLDIGPAAGEEDLDTKVLQVGNNLIILGWLLLIIAIISRYKTAS